jgi:ketosteroid isomerase-like protein
MALCRRMDRPADERRGSGMSASENKERMRSIFAATAEGQFDPLVEGMAEETTWTIMGSTPFSRTFAGKKAILEELLGPLRSRIAGTITLTASRFIAEDDFVVVEAKGNATTVEGVPYNNGYCFVFRLADGKIRGITEYIDTQLVMKAFGR